MAEKLSTFSIRGGAAVAVEIVAFSALGASLAWLMWAAIEPVGSMPSKGDAIAPPNTLDQLAARLTRIPDVAMSNATPAVAAARGAGGFILYGSRAGANGGGTAIISANGAPQASYSVGDEIVPGTRLARVETGHIEIDSGGQRLVVAFANSPSQTVGPPLTADAHEANTATPFVNALSLQPDMRPSGRSGFEITSQADLSVLGAYGLRPGDIVLKVNGADVSPASLPEHAAQLQAGRSLEITYERNGQTATTRIGEQAR